MLTRLEQRLGRLEAASVSAAAVGQIVLIDGESEDDAVMRVYGVGPRPPVLVFYPDDGRDARGAP